MKRINYSDDRYKFRLLDIIPFIGVVNYAIRTADLVGDSREGLVQVSSVRNNDSRRTINLMNLVGFNVVCLAGLNYFIGR